MADILYEIPQLAKQDCFNIVERHKSEFTYPLHKHKEYELNFVQNAKGVRRIVGDSVEEIGDYDLVLMPRRTWPTSGSRESANPMIFGRLQYSSHPACFQSPCWRKTSFHPLPACSRRPGTAWLSPWLP